ncbi:MBL fold metallo-hydrolase [Falsirhodobacter sp. 20TX0035]|uniref:MBL fold metallo-hydrolase n=1 Tax=Falsirhodobacter sp. 20TX0035 TaxID=3022019 RepID=UPI00233110B3|nr:MBL fold metallo-hydrolase [Falsirhodobacter sp. 20TX0035]MDB6454239.1 MBL fold metallo-hydrolase [Falsirhodobacter sp. 20TX0035]
MMALSKLLAATVLSAFPITAAMAQGTALPQAALVKLTEADRIAGDDRLSKIMRTYHCYYVDPEPASFRPKVSDQTDFLFGTRILDDVFYLGYLNLAVYAIETSDGLVLIDAGNTEEDGQRIVGWMQEMGYEPSDLRWVILTHEHEDHYGGLPPIRAFAPEAQILASADAVWDEGEAERLGPFDREITERTTLSVGNSEFVLLPTPGHTPGTLSVFAPVTVDGKPQVAAFWGGKGMRPNVERMQQMLASVRLFAEESEALGSFVPLNTHSWGDATISRLIDDMLVPDAPNSFLMTPEQSTANLQLLDLCTAAYLDAVEAGAIRAKD